MNKINNKIKKMAALVALLALVAVTVFAVGRTPPPPASVSLAWDASPGTNVIVNYNVYYGADSGNYTNVVATGTNLTTTVGNLVRGVTYYFAATAVDNNGLESVYSAEVSTTTHAPPAAPPNNRITGNN
jgi:fibronectin type 3 domain-containing protein